MQALEKLLQIMADLRDPENGCPWDIKQDFKSIAAYTVEEAYEVADAIEREDLVELKSELGDLMFQVVFHSQMAAEQEKFEFVDVLNAINEKLIRRHPHVFANMKVKDEAALFDQWEEHKKKERSEKEQAAGILNGIAATMPALRWSEKLQKRAAQHGFDWPSIAPVFDKLDEEVAELKAEIEIAEQQSENDRNDDNQVKHNPVNSNHERIADEMGDILFASVNLARHLGVNPEQALRDSNRRFISRFETVEQLLHEDSRKMEDCSVAVLETYWRKAKKLISSAEN